MIKWIPLLLVLGGCAQPQPQPNAQTPLVEEVSAAKTKLDSSSGHYVGTYTCPQGETGLELDLRVEPDGDASARFIFYSIEASDYPFEGSFQMRGFVTDAGAVSLQADEADWIKQPEGFVTIDLEGSIDFDTQTIEGVIPQPECSTFVVVRSEPTGK